MADHGGRSRDRRPRLSLRAVASTSRRITKEGSGNNKSSMSQTLTRKKQTIVRQEEHVPSPREAIQLSSFRGLRLTRRRKPSTKDGLRKWAYSARDCSAFRDKAVIVSYNILGVENASRHRDLYLTSHRSILIGIIGKSLFGRKLIVIAQTFSVSRKLTGLMICIIFSERMGMKAFTRLGQEMLAMDVLCSGKILDLPFYMKIT